MAYAYNIQLFESGPELQKDLTITNIRVLDHDFVFFRFTETGSLTNLPVLYGIYKNGQKIWETCIPFFTDHGLNENTEYTYYVTALATPITQ